MLQRTQALLEAEHKRDTDAVLATDLQHRDPRVRAAAARALARIADTKAHALLLARLKDADPEVVSWAAYGVGYSCAGKEYAAVRALVTRAASLSLTHKSLQPLQSGLEPFSAIADGLARCGGVEAEATLKAWLSSSVQGLPLQAALALNRLAARASSLHGETMVALLDRAAGTPPLHAALGAFSHFEPPNAAVAKRLRQVAAASLDSGGAAFAVRALAKSGPDAAPELHRVVVDAKRPLAVRLEAARELSRLEKPGQEAIRDALSQLAKDPAQVTAALNQAEFPLILELVSGLKAPLGPSQAALESLAAFPFNGNAADKFRTALLRCTAASRVAGTRSLYPALLECDPEDSFIKARSVLEVLDRGPLTRARYVRWSELSASKDHRVRQAALDLLPAHPEAADQHLALASALAAKEPGTVAVAAQIIARHPDRAAKSAEGTSFTPAPELVKALVAALSAPRDPSEIETVASLIDATAALQLKPQTKLIAKFCGVPNVTLRSHAEKALRALGDKRATCDKFTPPKDLAALSLPRSEGELVVEFELYSSRKEAPKLGLRLSPALAPIAVARVRDLVSKGFYTGISFHRVVPGFVVQFGDPKADGYGGAPGEPLRCETSPIPFGALGVGLALSGRDTASSQLFVTLGEFPRLDGAYPLLGRATGDWAAVTEGDVIRRATVVDP